MDQYLQHGKKFKYLEKVKVGNNWKYFYTPQELEAYYKKAKKMSDTRNNLATESKTGYVSPSKQLARKNNKTVNKSNKAVNKSNKKDTVSKTEQINKNTKSTSSSDKKAKTVAKGKSKVENIINKQKEKKALEKEKKALEKKYKNVRGTKWKDSDGNTGYELNGKKVSKKEYAEYEKYLDNKAAEYKKKQGVTKEEYEKHKKK